MAKATMDYKKITIEDMVNYIKESDNTPEAKAFIKGFYEEKPAKTKTVNKLDAEGKPITYIGKDGKLKIKKERVAVGKATKPVYNVLKAKKGFYERYKDKIDFTNAPVKAKADAKENKIEKALALLD